MGHPNVVTFNTLNFGFCKEGKLYEASNVFNEMKAVNVSPKFCDLQHLDNWE